MNYSECLLGELQDYFIYYRLYFQSDILTSLNVAKEISYI